MNILTIDVEEWFHILDNYSTRSEAQWKNYEVRIHENIDRVLNILEETDSSATFFIIGWVAKTYPDLVKKIANKYEIGSHTMSHQLVWQQSTEDFKRDVEYSIKQLEDLTGKAIKYFRAPGFSIRHSEAWAFEILMDLGIEIDCSVFPTHHAHGGFPEFGEASPKIIEVNGKKIKEFPISCHSVLGGIPIVYQGGGYFRLFPYRLIKKWAKKDNDYLLSYMHPRDFDFSQPVIKELSLVRRFKSYVGLKKAENKFRQFLTDFKFVNIGTADKHFNWNEAPIIYL